MRAYDRASTFSVFMPLGKNVLGIDDKIDVSIIAPSRLQEPAFNLTKSEMSPSGPKHLIALACIMTAIVGKAVLLKTLQNRCV